MKLAVINGPNLNTLGTRDINVYGCQSLGEIQAGLESHANSLGVTLRWLQSNLEGQLITWVQEARLDAEGIIINPGGFSHTSVALRDAIDASPIPSVECHLSNIAAREPFRHYTLTGAVCRGVISGFGATSYTLALDAAFTIVKSLSPT